MASQTIIVKTIMDTLKCMGEDVKPNIVKLIVGLAISMNSSLEETKPVVREKRPAADNDAEFLYDRTDSEENNSSAKKKSCIRYRHFKVMSDDSELENKLRDNLKKKTIDRYQKLENGQYHIYTGNNQKTVTQIKSLLKGIECEVESTSSIQFSNVSVEQVSPNSSIIRIKPTLPDNPTREEFYKYLESLEKNQLMELAKTHGLKNPVHSKKPALVGFCYEKMYVFNNSVQSDPFDFQYFDIASVRTEYDFDDIKKLPKEKFSSLYIEVFDLIMQKFNCYRRINDKLQIYMCKSDDEPDSFDWLKTDILNEAQKIVSVIHDEAYCFMPNGLNQYDVIESVIGCENKQKQVVNDLVIHMKKMFNFELTSEEKKQAIKKSVKLNKKDRDALFDIKMVANKFKPFSAPDFNNNDSADEAEEEEEM